MQDDAQISNEMLSCSRCDEPRRKSGRYCLKCHNQHCREWRKTHPLTPEQRKRDIARSMSRMYVKRGLIARLPCQLCGDPAAQRHHPDYDRPLLIVWLCKNHHRAVHADPKLAKLAARLALKPPPMLRGPYAGVQR